MAFSIAMPWSDGEHKMHDLMHAPEYDNPTVASLSAQAVHMLQRSPLLAVGVLDAQKRPWTTIWGGEKGFSEPLGGTLVGTRTLVDMSYDPVVEELVRAKFGTQSQEKSTDNRQSGSGVPVAAGGMMLGGLAIDLVTRKRVKLFGRIVAGVVRPVEIEDEGKVEEGEGLGEIQIVQKVEQSLGNCPKYLNKKEIRPALPHPKLLSKSVKLPEAALNLLSKADLFFISTSNGDIDMDTNHRGGPPGFVRVISNEEDGAEIIYPEYSGNRLYQSLGNLITTPVAGLVFPDFETGDVLYLTGETEILISERAEAFLPRSNLAVKIKITEARFVKEGLPFRGMEGELSPYNPAVRLLASEGNIASQFKDTGSARATLLSKTALSPSVMRHRFKTSTPASYKPGQWVAMDFSELLDIGYSHMRDDDPKSLNDDYIRTFTVSSHPSELPPDEFEITVRLAGPVTTFLSRVNPRSGLEVGLKGFGGDFVIETPSEVDLVPFVAGGVGITPLIGQLPDLDLKKLRFFWILKLDDADFVLDTLKKHEGLGDVTTVFFTGAEKLLDGKAEEKVENIRKLNAVVNLRRPNQDDLLALDVKKWYLCAGQALRKILLEWLKGKSTIFENFDY